MVNDAFRQSFTGGRVVVTAGVATLPEFVRVAAFKAVQSFDRFDADNDSHEKHDFSAATVGGVQLFWKIDCYDCDLYFRSLDRSDSAVTVRVLTIMLAEEY